MIITNFGETVASSFACGFSPQITCNGFIKFVAFFFMDIIIITYMIISHMPTVKLSDDYGKLKENTRLNHCGKQHCSKKKATSFFPCKDSLKGQKRQIANKLLNSGT